MTRTHLGNNVYIYWSKTLGDTIDNLAIDKAVAIDCDTGKISQYWSGSWHDSVFSTKTDGLFLTWQIQMTLTNIGTTYKDVYPSAFEGLPLGLDTSGYTKLGIVVAWGKNGGTGTHNIRIVNNADDTQVLVHSEGISGGMVTGTRRYYNIEIPEDFIDFRGEVKLQAKSSVDTDDPIFYGLWGYLIR